MLSFELLTSTRAGCLQTLGRTYGFTALHWEVTERLTHVPPAPKAPQSLMRVRGVLTVTNPELLRVALQRRIGKHATGTHPIKELGLLKLGPLHNPHGVHHAAHTSIHAQNPRPDAPERQGPFHMTTPPVSMDDLIRAHGGEGL